MKPKIDKTKFGSIVIRGVKYEHDVLIQLEGIVRKRKKKLSKEIYGTSHTISLPEAEYVYEDGVDWILIGTGQSGMVELSDEASAFFRDHGCEVILLPTPEAVQYWNEAKKAGIALFHVTC
jgi:hypothetical protein